MSDDRLQFGSLYLTRFAGSFGYITILTLLPTYIDLLDPSGLVIGLFTTALTLARGIAVIPISWAGDRFDKRTVLALGLVVNIAAYLLFSVIESSLGFIAARVIQGLGIVATGLISLALVGQLASATDRANAIGRYNAVRMGAGILGTLGAGAFYERFGFQAVFGLITVMLVVALVGVVFVLDPDESTVEGFAFTDLAVNRRILTLTSFRAQYAFSVTIVRNWVPIYAGVSAAKGGLGFSAFIVGVVIAAEKFLNMLGQPYTGRLSDKYGRALFVFIGGGFYGLIAIAIPFTPSIASVLPIGPSIPGLTGLSIAIVPLIVLNGLLGAADSFREPASMALFADEGVGSGIASSFGIRSLVWYPGSIIAPILGGILMTDYGMQWVFFLGGTLALTGVVTFFSILSRKHGSRALAEW
ncbi:MAG: MFS transporter [Halobacteriales archaeon]